MAIEINNKSPSSNSIRLVLDQQQSLICLLSCITTSALNWDDKFVSQPVLRSKKPEWDEARCRNLQSHPSNQSLQAEAHE